MGWLELRPELATGWRRLVAAMRDGPIPNDVIDACEQIVRHRVRLDAADGEPARSSAAAACMDLAEQFVLDVHGSRDDQVEAIRAHFGDAGVVQLVVALGLAEGMARADALVEGDGRSGG